MNITFGCQYVGSDPEEIQKGSETVDLKEAIDMFNKFPWESQLREAQCREESNLTSTVPSLYFYETENRYISISATDNKGFSIYYRQSEKSGDIFIPNNILEKPKGISVEQFIDDFFNHQIESRLKMFEEEKKEEEEKKGCLVFNLCTRKSRLFRPLFYLIIPAVVLFIEGNSEELVNAPEIFVGVAFIFVLFLILPSLLLNYSYWKNDKNQTIYYYPAQKKIIVKRGSKSFESSKFKVDTVEFIHSKSYGQSYVKFKINNITFAITYLSIDPIELLDILAVNFKTIEVFYPRINLKRESSYKTALNQERIEQKQRELVRLYSKWDNEQLEEVIENEKGYESYAVEVAKKILNKRKGR